ncbi:MAG: DUF4130 domain-containing protein [Candidatus Thermoplasmatota archaeon]
MLVLFGRTPRSMVTAFLVSRNTGAKPALREQGRQFYFDETLDADAVDYDAQYKEFRERFGGLDFLEDEKLYEIVEDEVFWASRYSSPDRFVLIFTVLGQIEKEGTRAYLAQRSPEAKEMKDRIRRVVGEFRRAKVFITFQEDERNKVLIGKAGLEHDIADLVLRHFAKKRPGYSVALLGDDTVHICYNDEILVDARGRFPERISRKDSGRYWTMMTDVKHLESRRDPKYSAEPLPKNYWKWVAEGAQDEQPRPKVTLEDFGA